MILDPATHRLLITPTLNPTPDPLYDPSTVIGDYAIEYAVLDGLNVIDIGLKSGRITSFNSEDPYPGQNDVTPTVAEGQRIRIIRVWMRSTADDPPLPALTAAIGIEPIPPTEDFGVALGSADLRFAEQMVYSDGRWTIYGVDGLPVTSRTSGSSPAAPAVRSVPFHAAAPTALTLTSQAVAAQFLANNNRNITLLDLAEYTECRLVARVATGSASANTPQLRVGYSTTFTTTVGSFSDIGTSPVVASLTTAGVARSAWVPLATNAAADAVYVTVLQEGGNASASPALGPVIVEFR
jgi:hypothetical protein